MISKTVFLTLKALLKRLSLAVVIIAQKSLRERPTVLAEDTSPLPDILSHGMKMVVRNQVKFVVTSIGKLVYDVM